MGGLGRSKYGKFWSHKWAMPPFRHFCTNRHEFWYPGLKLNFTATLFYKKNHFDRPFPPLTNPPPVAQKQPKVALFFCCESPSWHYVSVFVCIFVLLVASAKYLCSQHAPAVRISSDRRADTWGPSALRYPFFNYCAISIVILLLLQNTHEYKYNMNIE